MLGAGDGLITNVSLVLGVAGATPVASTVRLAGVAGLLDTLGSGGSRVFRTRRADPWEIVEEPAVSGEVLAAAEEYLVMGIHQLRAEGRPVRVAAAGTVVRLFLLPWTIAARTVESLYVSPALVRRNGGRDAVIARLT